MLVDEKTGRDGVLVLRAKDNPVGRRWGWCARRRINGLTPRRRALSFFSFFFLSLGQSGGYELDFKTKAKKTEWVPKLRLARGFVPTDTLVALDSA